jgi:plastocyanin
MAETYDQTSGLRATSLTRRSLLRFMVASVGVAAAASLLAACGGDDDDDDGGNSTATTAGASSGATSTTADTEPTEATDETDATEPATEAAGDNATATIISSGSGEAGENYTVEATEDIKYDPAELTIKVGDTVTWVVVGSIPHSATCDPSKTSDPTHAVLPEGAEPWDSGILQEGQEFSHTFDVAGDYTYFCIPHDSMTMLGKVTVEA